jgi:hypothetical protein
MRLSPSVPADAGRQRRGVDVVELDPHVPLRDRDRLVEPAVRDPQVVEHPQRLPGEPAELGWSRLPSSSLTTTSGQDHLVLVEAGQRPGSDSRTEVSRTNVFMRSSRRACLSEPGPGRGAGRRPLRVQVRTSGLPSGPTDCRPLRGR